MNRFTVSVALVILLDFAGVLSAKFYSLSKGPLFLLATILLFGGAGYMFAQSLKYEGIAITNALWTAFSVIIVSIFGYFVFKEEIAPIQLIGIGVIAVGLILINLK